MTRLLGAVLASLLLLVATAPGARAGETWCDTDPPVLITTPAGNLAVVYVVTSGPAEHLASLLTPSITYTVQSTDGGTATNVKLTVTIADDLLGNHYAVGSEVWSGLARTGELYASQRGYSGQALQMQFKLAVP
jgi:hypothetical protein